tara:strand:+ start:132 stop:437 length:306 start_codon:yes stop_codon:yes gene_type:complete
MHKFGEVVLVQIQFVDTYQVKTRPSLVLFEEYGNVVVAAITSNNDMEGVQLLKKEGAIKDSIIKINYIFTVSNKMIKKTLFSISNDKKKIVKKELFKRIGN